MFTSFWQSWESFQLPAALFNFSSILGTCGGIIKATNGTFFSPNFPLNYPPSKNCVWQVEADEGYQIIVNFTHFNVEGMKTECAYDYVLIEDEEGGEERYCGDYTQPLVYTSTSNRIKAHFVSDNSVGVLFLSSRNPFLVLLSLRHQLDHLYSPSLYPVYVSGYGCRLHQEFAH